MSRKDIADLEFELGRFLDDFRQDKAMTTAEVVGVLQVVSYMMIEKGKEEVELPKGGSPVGKVS